MHQSQNVQKYIAEKLSPQSKYKDFPERRYIINHQYKFIYCPIPKVASSSIKHAIISLTEKNHNGKSIHLYARGKLSLQIYHQEDAQKFLNDKKYWKFVFIRNPWNRLISGYMSKFISRHNQLALFSKKVIDLIYDNHGMTPDHDKSITFRQFVEYVSRTDEEGLNVHWRPQYLFLSKKFPFDFIGKYENFVEDFSYIQQKLGCKLEIPWRNKSDKKAKLAKTSKEFCDYYPDELRALPNLPIYQQFYDKELISMVAKKYHKDIEIFDYKFY